MEERKILSVKDLQVEFRVRGRTLRAIRGISLDFYQGEAVAIVGESGSGKSVLTKTFCGMLENNGRVVAGSIEFEGHDLAKLKGNKAWNRIRGGKIATVFQDPMTSLNPILTIGKQITDVICAHQDCSRAEGRRRALAMMERVGITNAQARFNDYPFQYSGGMRQRIVIAIALSCQPKVLICDEPTTALDVTIQTQILQLIRDLQKEFGYTVIFITHDLGVVANIADRVAVLYAGQVVELAKTEDLFYDPRHPYTWALLSSLPQLATQEGELYAITGTPPSLYSQISADAFAPRNPYALNIDRLMEAPQFQVSPTHWAKTWLLDPRAPRVEKPQIIQNLHEKLKREVVGEGIGEE